MRTPHHPRVVALLTTLATAVVVANGCDGASPKVVHSPAPTLATVASSALRAPSDFDVIADKDERSRALFLEATRVMFHPRCINCHPSDDSPRQGDLGVMHDPPVVRGPDDEGVPNMMCRTCHQDANVQLARVPGAPKWHLAPKVMAWVGRTPASLCAQLKNPATNGGKTLAQIADHTAHDPLVAWGWAPGADRVPAPGTQAQFGALITAWMDTGAVCPKEEAK